MRTRQNILPYEETHNHNRSYITPELEPSGELMDEEDRKEAEHMVRKSAQNVFILTSVSQNGALDVFTCLSMNISLIRRLVDLRGRRPSLGQVFRLYVAVASSSVLIASADEALDDLNLGELLGMSGVNAGHLVEIDGSAVSAVSSFHVVKMGYVDTQVAFAIGDLNRLIEDFYSSIL